MEETDAKTLLKKYLSGSASDEEIALLEAWYAQFEKPLPEIDNFSKEQQLENIRYNLITHSNMKPVRLWPRIAAAASLLIAIGFAAYFYSQPAKHIQMAKNDVAPGGTKAILTLSNGQKIILNNAKNGVLVKQASTVVNKTANGQLIYRSAVTVSAIAYNTITTPNGKYQVILSDGTKVWLNAGTSLRYPVAFVGKERNVELNGEAYFEVAKNKLMPFHVKTTKQTIEVLGTHFDVMAYTDEKNTETTLLEGSVRVNAGEQTLTIKPGQQAIMNELLSLNTHPDTEQITAWKEDLFEFQNTPMSQVARQIERWYDVKVSYSNVKPGITFTGILSRNNPLSKLINLLESTGSVKFTIAGQNVIVKSTNP